jgi:hypothetical protein
MKSNSKNVNENKVLVTLVITSLRPDIKDKFVEATLYYLFTPEPIFL